MGGSFLHREHWEYFYKEEKSKRECLDKEKREKENVWRKRLSFTIGKQSVAGGCCSSASKWKDRKVKQGFNIVKKRCGTSASFGYTNQESWSL